MIRKSNKLKLQEYFFLHPTSSLRIREIERATHLPLPSVARYVKELIKEGILQKKNIGRTTFYTVNRESGEYRFQKRLANLSLLHEYKLISHLVDRYHNAPIRLFGSYSRGEDIEESDIDIYIQTPLTPISLSVFEKKLQRSIQLFCTKNIHDLQNKELANNVINGIPLNGYIEVFV